MPLFQKSYTTDEINELESLRDIKGLLKALNNPDSDTRLNVVVTMGRLGGKDVIQALINTLQTDPNGSVRYFAATSLGQVGGSESISPLAQALLEHKHNIHQAAAEALGEIADRIRNPILFEAATKQLVPLLKANQDVREVVITALGKIRDPRTTQALAAVMAKSFNKPEIRCATEALIRIGKPAVGPLRAILSEAQDLNATAAAFALGRIGDPAAAPTLIEALRHFDDEVRRQAAIALGRLQARLAVPDLIAALNDNDAPVRAAVATALGDMRAVEAVETLQSLAMYDFQASVRQAADAALKKIE